MQVSAHLYTTMKREEKTLDRQIDKFCIVACVVAPEIKDPLQTESLCFSTCSAICCPSGLVHTGWVFSLWNLETRSVRRTPCVKCYTNTHAKESLQLKNYTMGNFYTKATHSEAYGNNESI